MTAWILRFPYNTSNRSQRKAGALGVEKVKEGELYWKKWAHREQFAAEVESLLKGRPVSRTSRTASLDRIEFGVGERIDKAELPWYVKHPIILDYHTNKVLYACQNRIKFGYQHVIPKINLANQ